MSVVHIIEGPYFYNECVGIFPRPSELSILERCVCIREVSVRRGSTVFYSLRVKSNVMISNHNVEFSILRMTKHLVKTLDIIIPFLC